MLIFSSGNVTNRWLLSCRLILARTIQLCRLKFHMSKLEPLLWCHVNQFRPKLKEICKMLIFSEGNVINRWILSCRLILARTIQLCRLKFHMSKFEHLLRRHIDQFTTKLEKICKMLIFSDRNVINRWILSCRRILARRIQLCRSKFDMSKLEPLLLCHINQFRPKLKEICKMLIFSLGKCNKPLNIIM